VSAEVAEAFMTWFKRRFGRLVGVDDVVVVVVVFADVGAGTGVAVVAVVVVELVVVVATSDVIGDVEVGILGVNSPFLSLLRRAAFAQTGRGFQIRKREGWPSSGTFITVRLG